MIYYIKYLGVSAVGVQTGSSRENAMKNGLQSSESTAILTEHEK